MRPTEFERTAAELLLRLEGRVSELADLLNGQSLNNVLWVGTVVLDNTGRFQQSFRVPFGSISAANAAATPVTITNTPLESTAPAQGRGVIVVGANGDGTWNVAGEVLSVYGTAGGTVVLQVMSNPQTPNL